MAQIKLMQRKNKEIVEYYFQVSVTNNEPGIENMDVSKMNLFYLGEKVESCLPENWELGIKFNFRDTKLFVCEAQEKHIYTFSSGKWSVNVSMNVTPKFYKQIDLFE